MLRLTTYSFMFSAFCFMSCFPEDYDRCGEGFRFENNDCHKQLDSGTTNTDKQDNIGDEGNDDIGSACRCEGEGCILAGAPVPHGGTPVGCEAVPTDWPGATAVCMRSYTGELSAPLYFAEGFCSLQAMDCSGDDIICSGAGTGDYATMKSCPENTVMLMVQINLEYADMPVSGVLDQKLCVPSCEENEDCRSEVFDDVHNEPGQYQCLDKDGVKFCYDPRNLPSEYSVEAF